ncbi:PA2169 family four-helix-bundle protein [Pedobacter alpinus]|uniref:PA2169 family four-helix-bundle protein n=1 Tax=Pedobacter alpinus TaxID=1590643 RepID=A0ABW5TRC5_9SPHI
METNQQISEILNDLVQINNDRVEGYEKAIAELRNEDGDLKALFLSMIHESRSYKMALSTELNVLGADTETDTTTSGKIYRAWMDIKALFTGHDRKTVLSNCEFGEDAAQKAYEMALDEEAIPAHLRQLITEQKHSLKLSHDQIKALRDQNSY